jgi:Ras-related protein Rab-1A
MTVEGHGIRLQIWDTAGQERFRTITKSYYRGAHAIIIMYDITCRKSFERVRNWIEEVRRHQEEGICYLIGGKLDLEGQRTVFYQEGLSLAHSIKASFY